MYNAASGSQYIDPHSLTAFQGAGNQYDKSIPVCVVQHNMAGKKGSKIPDLEPGTQLNYLCLRSLVRVAHLPMPSDLSYTRNAFAAACNYPSDQEEIHCTDGKGRCGVTFTQYLNFGVINPKVGCGTDYNIVDVPSRYRLTALVTTATEAPSLSDGMAIDFPERRWICAVCLGSAINLEGKLVYMVAVNALEEQCYGCATYRNTVSFMEHAALAFVF